MVTKLKARKAPRAALDPIFAAIAEHKARDKEYWRLWTGLDEAEGDTLAKYGSRPSGMIAWRQYSMIGGSEIDTSRDELLQQPGLNPEQVEKEYLDAIERLRDAERERVAWDYRVGVASLREQCECADEAQYRAAMRMARTKPTTPAGAGALVAYALHDIKEGLGPKWPLIALRTAAAMLARMKRKAA